MSQKIPRKALILDLLSKLLCVGALAFLMKKTWGHYELFPKDTRLILLLIAESFTIFLVVIARPTEQVMRKPLIMAATVISSCYFLFIELEGGRVLVPLWVGRSLQITGILIELVAKAWIWRSFGLLPSHRGLVLSGPYKLIRHPMYFGYFLGHVGFFLCAANWRNLVVFAVLYALILFRILKEEEFLKKDPTYASYMSRTKYRLWPPLF